MNLKDYRWHLEGSHIVYDDLELTDCIITVNNINYNSYQEKTTLDLLFTVVGGSYSRSFDTNMTTPDQITTNGIVEAIEKYYPSASQIIFQL